MYKHSIQGDATTCCLAESLAMQDFIFSRNISYTESATNSSNAFPGKNILPSTG